MLYLGSRAQDDVWLAFVPNSLLDNDPHAPLDMTPVDGASSTALSPDHAYMAVMFFASMFSALRFQDIDCNDDYPDPISFQAVTRATDIL